MCTDSNRNTKRIRRRKLGNDDLVAKSRNVEVEQLTKDHESETSV